MTKVRISKGAATYLRSERAYLAKLDTRAAENFRQRLTKAMTTLSEYPDVGVQSTAEGLRRFAVPPYILEYRHSALDVLIVRIRHGRQHEGILHKDDDLDP